jgi:DNA-binding GntR family transcriptional regulator
VATRVSKHELAYSAVRQRIISGDYAPGARLVIPTLARELGVSALPIREALRRLEAEGLVQFDHNVGARVGMASIEEWESAMHVLSLLEGYATALAAENLSAEDVAELYKINQALSEALERSDLGSAKSLNRQFHVRLYEACPNDYLMSLVRLGWDRLDSLRGWDVYHLLIRGSRLVHEHAELLTMIESGASAADIETFARDHKLRTVEVYRQNRDVLRMVPGGADS